MNTDYIIQSGIAHKGKFNYISNIWKYEDKDIPYVKVDPGIGMVVIDVKRSLDWTLSSFNDLEISLSNIKQIIENINDPNSDWYADKTIYKIYDKEDKIYLEPYADGTQFLFFFLGKDAGENKTLFEESINKRVLR